MIDPYELEQATEALPALLARLQEAGELIDIMNDRASAALVQTDRPNRFRDAHARPLE